MEKFRFVGYNKNKYIKYIVGAVSHQSSVISHQLCFFYGSQSPLPL